MDPEDLLPCSQKPATCSYTEPDRSSPCPHPTSLKSILILPSRVGIGLPSSLFPLRFPTKTLYVTLLLPPPPAHLSLPGYDKIK